MSETTDITYICKIRGYSRYKLVKDANGNLNYVTIVPSFVYANYTMIEFLNPCYAQDTNRLCNSIYDMNLDEMTLYIPIMTDSVSTSDFNAYENKQISLPIPPTQTITWNGLPSSWNNPVYKKEINAKFEEPKGCSHEWTTYMGLNHSFEFCKKCDEKRNV